MNYLLLLSLLLLTGCDALSCGESHGAVTRARALSAAQLQALHEEMVAFGVSNERNFNRKNASALMRELNPIRVEKRGTPGEVSVKLAGCLDEYIFLTIRRNPDWIELLWANGSQPLWRREAKP